MKRFGLFLCLALLVGGTAYAALDEVPRFLKGGAYVGNTTTKIVKHISSLVTVDLAAAAASTCSVTTATLTGAALGDQVVCTPTADDAALDEGTFSCFVESANTVKIAYCADATGGNVASQSWRLSVWQY